MRCSISRSASALDGESLSEAASGSPGVGRRAGSAQRQVGGDRPRETGRGAGALANPSTPVHENGLSFFEGMRLLAGSAWNAIVAGEPPGINSRVVTGLTAGPGLEAMLNRLKSHDARQIPSPPELRAELRPYQQSGLSWLHFLTQLGPRRPAWPTDMGFGKTVQVIALLLALKRERESADKGGGKAEPSLLVVPASLIANWKARSRGLHRR